MSQTNGPMKNYVFTKELLQKTVFRCLSPFKIGINIYLEQSVWADLSWNPVRKRIASIWTKSLRKKISGQNLDFSKSYFQFLRWNWVFRTNMKSNAAVTLHFEDLAVHDYLFLKDVCIFWWKISNCLKKHFRWMWTLIFFIYIFWRTSVTVCEKGHFLPFLAHYYVKSSKYLKIKTLHSSKCLF